MRLAGVGGASSFVILSAIWSPSTSPITYNLAVPDLVADQTRVYGLESLNLNGLNVAMVWEPYSSIILDSGITNIGGADTAQAFNM
jgi:hypothetical protein